MSLVDYVRTLTRHWYIIVVLALLGGSLGALAVHREVPLYRSTSQVILTAEAGGNAAELVQGSTYVSNLVDSYVQVATSDLVLEPVVEDLGLDMSTRALASSVSVESPLNTMVIDISVVNPRADQAQEIAAAVTEQLSVATEAVSPSSSDGPAVRLTTLTSASLPSMPVSPNVRLYLLAGTLAGALLGVLIALARRVLGTTVGGEDDVALVTDLPVLGQVVESRETLPQAMLAQPLGREAESLRALAANLRFLGVDRSLGSLIVTSGNPREGKSSLSCGIALAQAEASDRVLLIDADLRAPTLSDLTNLSNSVGLSDVLVGGITLQDAVQQWAVPGLDVLTSGTVPPNPAQLMGSEAMVALLAEAAKTYDHVVIDTPPVLLVTDALLLSLHVDGVMLVARHGRTSTRALGRTLSALENAPALGVALSRVPRGQRSAYGQTPTASRHAQARNPAAHG